MTDHSGVPARLARPAGLDSTGPSDDFAVLWPRAASTETAWLEELAGSGVTGFMPPPMPDAAWVLNAMYEHESGPTDATYDDLHRARVAEGLVPTRMIGDMDLNTIGTATGGGLGRAEHPGPGWRRLRWAELAGRVGDPVVPEGMLPCFRCFPSAKIASSWPLGIRPPTEGSMDRATWNRVTAVLAENSPDGADTRCLAYYNPLMLGCEDFDDLHVRAGRLGDAAILYDTPDADFSPSNLWAQDRSWVLCTDYDLWGTKIAGPSALIEALLSDPELESVRLPWAR
ncbi:hypothetical protein [Yinghuangia soli]|uniref:Uncharacterized protein n=1 Tax=Yinghuangia soli TaxID=2908204 RepID=A0AA41Q4A1_9ACTN|nr:hypothetical protein [Yinghuangia soli]MCF2530720.1 hypothetical protein [Yinghuangia soli]